MLIAGPPPLCAELHEAVLLAFKITAGKLLRLVKRKEQAVDYNCEKNDVVEPPKTRGTNHRKSTRHAEAHL